MSGDRPARWPSGEPAARAWARLHPAWQECFELAWQSFRSGGIAVGAVLTDSGGQVTGRGQNRRFGSDAQAGGLTGLLGHAEINALLALPADKDRGRDHVLYTTLQPCPMCLGAIVVARVDVVKFAAADPTWAGIERLPELNTEVFRRWPAFEGPVPGPLGTWAAILPALGTSGSLLRALQARDPGLAALAETMTSALRAGTPPLTAAGALELAWDQLIAATR
jgi:tRNA(Arg) A34 adenosine deaminase TadA